MNAVTAHELCHFRPGPRRSGPQSLTLLVCGQFVVEHSDCVVAWPNEGSDDVHEVAGKRVVVPIVLVAKEFPFFSQTTADLAREWVAMNRDCLSYSRPTGNMARNNGDSRIQSLLPALARLKKIQ